MAKGMKVELNGREVLDFCMGGHPIQEAVEKFGVSDRIIRNTVLAESNGMKVCQHGFHTFKGGAERGRNVWICPACLPEYKTLHPDARKEEPRAKKPSKPEPKPKVLAVAPKPEPTEVHFAGLLPNAPTTGTPPMLGGESDAKLSAFRAITAALEPLSETDRKAVIISAGLLFGQVQI